MAGKYVELSFDPGSRNLGQSLTQIRDGRNANDENNYVIKHVTVYDCIGKNTTKFNTDVIIQNLYNHLDNNKVVQHCIKKYKKNFSLYKLEAVIESQEGISFIKNPSLTGIMIKMGTIAGALYMYFLIKGIKVKFLHKKLKWGYSQSKIKKKIPINKNGIQNKKRGRPTKDSKAPQHKTNTKNTVMEILEKQNTLRSQKILNWILKNKNISQHVQDSILGGMYRLKERITQ
jgi:hypothetical protein